MKPIFTKVVATATTEKQTAATIKLILDNLQYLDKIKFIKANGYKIISVRVKNKVYKVYSYKKEWQEIIKYLYQHNWVDYFFEDSIEFCNPRKYTK